MTKNIHVLKTSNSHFLNGRRYLSPVQACCYRFELGLCNDKCKLECDPEVKSIINEILGGETNGNN